MFSRPDTQSFSKFLASAGVLLCVIAFVGPALVLRDTSTLRITTSELQALTPSARAEVRRRQAVSEDVARASVPLGVAALLAGTVLLGFGLWRLKKQEDREDELADTALTKAKVELADLTPAEREQQADEEVVQELASEARLQRGGPEGPEGEPSPAAPERVDVGSLRAQVAEFEGQVLAKVRELTPASHRFRAHVKALLEPPIRIDGLLRSPPGQGPDVLVEIGVVRDIRNRGSIRMRVDRTVATTTVYRENVDESAVAWVVIVALGREGGGYMGSAAETERIRKGIAVPAWLTISVVGPDEIDGLTLPPGLQ